MNLSNFVGYKLSLLDNFIDKVPEQFRSSHEEYYKNSLNSYYKKTGDINTVRSWVDRYNEYIGYDVFEINISNPEGCVSTTLPTVIVTAPSPSSGE